MLTSKQTTLKPLLESKDGIHLTAYLINRGNLIDLKAQLRATINDAHEWLNKAMPLEEQKKFLEPLTALLNDTRIFKHMKGNIGIFRSAETFRVLNIPIEVQQSCQVATSFHVKPLLRWLQGDQEFLFLGLEKDSAHLYLGSQDTFKHIDSILFPNLSKENKSLSDYASLKKARQNKIKEVENYVWLNDWITEITKNYKPRLFVAGEPLLIQALNGKLKYKNLVSTPVFNSFSRSHVIEPCQIIRKIQKEESKKLIEKALLEFRFAEEGNRAKKNIFQISRAVVQGKVRKLIVTDEISMFGRIDEKSGGIAIHPVDLDHEDDCILDDLAQMVLSKGGEVIIAKRDEIPKGRPILAILGDEDEGAVKTEDVKYKAFQVSVI